MLNILCNWSTKEKEISSNSGIENDYAVKEFLCAIKFDA